MIWSFQDSNWDSNWDLCVNEQSKQIDEESSRRSLANETGLIGRSSSSQFPNGEIAETVSQLIIAIIH